MPEGPLVSPLGAVVGGVVVGALGLAVIAWLRHHRGQSEAVPAVKKRPEPTSQVQLVEHLVWIKMLSHPSAIAAFSAVDRARYVNYELAEAAFAELNPYADLALPIGFNATLSSPHMHALALDLLAGVLAPGDCVLDIGSGSGFMTACLAHMVGGQGRVHGVEHITELAEQGKGNVSAGNPQLLPRVQFHVGDGFDGLEEKAPFKAIYVGAAAPSLGEVQKLVDQLTTGGRMIIPVGSREGFHQLLQVDVKEDGTVAVKNHGTVRFVPLTSKKTQMEADVTSGIAQPITLASGKQAFVRTYIVPAPDTSIEDYRILRTELKIKQQQQQQQQQ